MAFETRNTFTTRAAGVCMGVIQRAGVSMGVKFRNINHAGGICGIGETVPAIGLCAGSIGVTRWVF